MMLNNIKKKVLSATVKGLNGVFRGLLNIAEGRETLTYSVLQFRHADKPNEFFNITIETSIKDEIDSVRNLFLFGGYNTVAAGEVTACNTTEALNSVFIKNTDPDTADRGLLHSLSCGDIVMIKKKKENASFHVCMGMGWKAIPIY